MEHGGAEDAARSGSWPANALSDIGFEAWLPPKAAATAVLLVAAAAVFVLLRRSQRAKDSGCLASIRPEGVSFSQAVHIVLVCSTFMLVGPALMLLNKRIMQTHGFPFPLSLSALGVVFSAVFARGAVALGLAFVRPESLEVTAGLRQWLRIALPVGVCKAASLATGNAAYLHLGLGFIQMLKSFTPAVVLLVMSSLGSNRPSRASILFVFVIVAGTVVEVEGELNASLVGLVQMLASLVVEAVNLVLTQKLLQDSRFTTHEAMYVLAPPSALCLLFVAAVLEWPQMLQEGHVATMFNNLGDFAGAALLGVGVNFVTMFVVQATSGLFVKILNTFRCVCLVFIGVLAYGEPISSVEVIGYSVALLGFVGYNYVQLFPKKAAELEQALDAVCCYGRPLSPRSCNHAHESPKAIREISV